MITQHDINKILKDVNDVLSKLDKRLTDLEAQSKKPVSRQSSNSNAKS